MSNINYSPSDEEFWDFTWDDFALTDLPTQVRAVECARVMRIHSVRC